METKIYLVFGTEARTDGRNIEDAFFTKEEADAYIRKIADTEEDEDAIYDYTIHEITMKNGSLDNNIRMYVD